MTSITEINNLPEELLEYILSHLSVILELQSAAQVCTLWRKLCLSIFKYKFQTFHSQSRQGNFVWRKFSKNDQKTPLHFIPRHIKSRTSVNQLNTPSPRIMHGIAFHGKTIFIYGGETSSRTSFFNDMFGYDVLEQKWQKFLVQGIPPTPRSTFSLTQFEDNLIVTGGFILSRISSIRPIDQFYDDIHVYNISKNLWYKAGNLERMRSSHSSLCLSNRSDSVRLVLSGGMHQLFEMSDTIELCHFVVKDDKYTKQSSHSFVCPHTRREHSIAKIDEYKFLMYGGFTKVGDGSNKFFIRNDAWLIEFNNTYTDIQFTSVAVNNINAYSGMYPISISDSIRVKNSLIYFQRYNYIKGSVDYPDFFEVDNDRKPTGDEMYRQDFYHTFILDLDKVLINNSISWVPVSRNPLKFAPRNSIFHRTILAGDSIFLFGGYVLDHRTKQTKDSNDLYKIDVFRNVS